MHAGTSNRNMHIHTLSTLGCPMHEMHGTNKIIVRNITMLFEYSPAR